MPGHIGLNVTDLDRSIAFYQSVFGFELQGRDGARYAFLGRADVCVLTLWQQSEGQFSGDRPGLHHLSFDVPSVADVHAATARLADLGIALIYDQIRPHAPGEASGGIFFADPDGTRLEICTASGLDEAVALEHGEPSCGFF